MTSIYIASFLLIAIEFIFCLAEPLDDDEKHQKYFVCILFALFVIFCAFSWK